MSINKLIYLSVLPALFLIFTACAPNSPNEGQPVSADRIHIAGEYGSWNTAFYWNNGELTILDSPSGNFHVSASCVTVYNGTVYVGGAYNGKPCYWVNGARTDIDCTSGSITGIAVDSSGRLVMAGVCDNEASVWTDGRRTALNVPSGFHGEVTAMTVSGSTVFAAGHCIADDWSSQTPCYWRDGTYYALPESMSISPGGEAIVYDIAVDGESVIVAGDFDTSASDEGAGYWKDGVWRGLDGTSARSVAFSGKNIFIAGRDSGGACYWLDDRKEELKAVYSTIATAAASAGSDLVASGKRGPTGGNDSLGYWTGGSFFEIYEASIADVNGLFITE